MDTKGNGYLLAAAYGENRAAFLDAAMALHRAGSFDEELAVATHLELMRVVRAAGPADEGPARIRRAVVIVGAWARAWNDSTLSVRRATRPLPDGETLCQALRDGRSGEDLFRAA